MPLNGVSGQAPSVWAEAREKIHTENILSEKRQRGNGASSYSNYLTKDTARGELHRAN